MIAAKPISEVQRTLDSPPTERRRRHYLRGRPLYFAAVLVLLSAFGMAVFIFCTARLIATGDAIQGWWALAGMAGYLVFKGMAAVLTRSIRCQLCHGNVLKDRGCRKHKESAKLPLISHRLTAALQAVFCARFTCMYCGTPYRLKK